ncbi:TetR/AcrR family transcriptional regulator [Microbacteriaceae bacterium VKM Ac-2855]|nr:TetR/AcrR family transcriptional regulator [Microbacteriaceae bacterium VKM Ac-2855]
MSIVPSTNRRRTSDSRYRVAILDAAGALMTERGRPDFTVDELAERAGVARRTVFNYFSSVDDVIIAECRRKLANVIGSIEAASVPAPSGARTRRTMFEEMTGALRQTDFPAGIAVVWAALGAQEQPTGRYREFAFDALTRTADQLVLPFARRGTETDVLECELLAGALTSGIVVITTHWLAATDGRTSDAARALWSELLNRLIESLERGYL